MGDGQRSKIKKSHSYVFPLQSSSNFSTLSCIGQCFCHLPFLFHFCPSFAQIFLRWWLQPPTLPLCLWIPLRRNSIPPPPPRVYIFTHPHVLMLIYSLYSCWTNNCSNSKILNCNSRMFLVPLPLDFKRLKRLGYISICSMHPYATGLGVREIYAMKCSEIV